MRENSQDYKLLGTIILGLSLVISLECHAFVGVYHNNGNIGVYHNNGNNQGFDVYHNNGNNQGYDVYHNDGYYHGSNVYVAPTYPYTCPTVQQCFPNGACIQTQVCE